jgi:hypothetical protein
MDDFLTVQQAANALHTTPMATYNISQHGMFSASYSQTPDGTITSVSIELCGEDMLNLPITSHTVDQLMDLRKAAMDVLQHLHLRKMAEASGGGTTDEAEQRGQMAADQYSQAHEREGL